jgi:MFS family permease
MNSPTRPPGMTPRQTADAVADTFFGVTDEASRRRVIRQCFVSAAEFAVGIPALFYLRFGRVGPLGWGTTVFFVVYCLLCAVGLYFRPRAEYHTPVRMRGDWLDRVGAFWLVGCAFGPFFGWILTTGTIPVTHASWHWLYGLRVVLAAVVPAALALPLTRYVRGKSARVALPLLVLVTLLPISSAMNVSLDLWEGTSARQSQTDGQTELYLKHTGRRVEAGD